MGIRYGYIDEKPGCSQRHSRNLSMTGIQAKSRQVHKGYNELEAQAMKLLQGSRKTALENESRQLREDVGIM